MKNAINLPCINENGCYEIRLESIGGLGANLCGKMLGELGAIYLGLNSASFSSYGSEKRGSPVKAYIRWCSPQKELLINSPVRNPHILGLFHEAMARMTSVTAGVCENTKIVMNTDLDCVSARDFLKLCYGEMYCIDALKIAMECKSGINMVMLGAIIRASGFIPIHEAIKMAEETIGEKYPELLKYNIAGLKRGYEECISQKFEKDGKYAPVKYSDTSGTWGWDNAPLGGVNPIIGSTITNDLSASRQGYVPIFIEEKCINCGLCDTTCPDMVFRFEMGEYRGRKQPINKGLDYHHCKGCLRCVEICPVGALISGKEREQNKLKNFVRNKDLLPIKIAYETEGSNPEITGEAYLDEKRIDGGLV